MSFHVATPSSPKCETAPDLFSLISSSNSPFTPSRYSSASSSSSSATSSASSSSCVCSPNDARCLICGRSSPALCGVSEPFPALPCLLPASLCSSATSLVSTVVNCALPSREVSPESAGGKRSCRGWFRCIWSACVRAPRSVCSTAFIRWVFSVLLLPATLCRSVRKAVGSRFFLLLISVYLCLKGLVYSLSTAAMLPYFKGLGWQAAAYQQATAIVFVPWGMKGLVGTLADAIPLFGYRKKYYMLIASVLGVGGVFGLCILPDEFAADRLWLVCLLLLLVQLQVATLDLMCEGKYSELMVEVPDVGPAVVTFVNALISVGQATGKMVVGPVSDRLGARPLFWLALPLAVSVFVPICLNYLPEKKLDHADLQVLRRHLWAQKNVFVMGIALATASLGVAVVSLFEGQRILIIYSLCAGVALSLVCCLTLPKPIAHCNMYFFLDQVLHLNVAGALDFFYTASPACLPDGPHFDYTYYNTYACIAGAIGGVVVLVLFLKVLPQYSFRHILTTACLVRLGASLVDYALVSRLTTELHLSDKAVYLVGDAVILVGANALSYMVGVMLISKLCPKHVEVTVYAILAGMGNMGSTLSTLLGVAAIKEFRITSKAEESCDFSRMPQLISISNFILPSLCIPLCMTLLPNTAMNAPLPVTTELEETLECSCSFAQDAQSAEENGWRGGSEERAEDENSEGSDAECHGSGRANPNGDRESGYAEDRHTTGNTQGNWRKRRARRHARNREKENERSRLVDEGRTAVGGVACREGQGKDERPSRPREKRKELDVRQAPDEYENCRNVVPVVSMLVGTELVGVRCEERNTSKRVGNGEESSTEDGEG
ncbi:BT1 family protein [Toxoplasma gondii ARI]|uniref:BT1 family protein n=1 Tax=Toxoplasma gondii ARI TaxID=1074872 RepID=A0A139XZ39_TOXGO|nr:BT1 family protein [Toxoplasma gondii ARI]